MSLTVKLSDGINSRHILPGTLLTGVVTLALPKQKTITNAKIFFTGKIVTEYSEVRVGTAGNTHGPRRHAVERITLFTYETVFFPGSFTVPAQTFEWPFELQVPKEVECERRSTDENPMHRNLPFANDGLCHTPPTFEWRDSTTTHVVVARIKYKLVAAVDIGSGLFKHTMKQKLPILVSNIFNCDPLGATLRSMSEVRMYWHRFSMEYVVPRAYHFTYKYGPSDTNLQAALSFPDRIPIPYSDHLAMDGQSDSTSPNNFQFRIMLLSKAPRAASAPELTFSELRSYVKGAKLTLNQIVTVRVASTPRLVRNVGTKMIASGGQGYGTKDVLVTRTEVLLPEYSISGISEINENPASPRSGIFDIDISEWAQAVNEALTELSGRSNANDQPEGKGKRKSHSIKNTPVVGFKSYTVSVEHSLMVEIDLYYDEPSHQAHRVLKIDIPIVLESLHSSGFREGVDRVHPTPTRQDQAKDSHSTPSSDGHTKEQEALRDQSNSASHSRHGMVDEELPRYEENVEASPPPPPPPPA